MKQVVIDGVPHWVVIPVKALFNSSLIHDVVTSGRKFVVNQNTGELTIHNPDAVKTVTVRRHGDPGFPALVRKRAEPVTKQSAHLYEPWFVFRSYMHAIPGCEKVLVSKPLSNDLETMLVQLSDYRKEHTYDGWVERAKTGEKIFMSNYTWRQFENAVIRLYNKVSTTDDYAV